MKSAVEQMTVAGEQIDFPFPVQRVSAVDIRGNGFISGDC